MPSSKLISDLGLRVYLGLLLRWFWRRLQALVWETDTRSAEVIYGLIAFGWAVLLSRSDLFAAGAMVQGLELRMEHDTWRFIFMALALAQWGVALSAPPREGRFARLAIWLAASAVWGYIAVIAVTAVPPSSAVAVYVPMLLGSVWAFLNTLERR